MPFWRLYYHLVWGTKNRGPLIDEGLENHLFPYLIDRARELECKVLAISGWNDHVHMVISIPPKYAVAEVVKRLKGASSHDFEDLGWQRGYGVLSVGERQCQIAIGYVENQKKHHAQQTTIAPLERMNEDEVGVESRVVHKAGGEYIVGEDLPF